MQVLRLDDVSHARHCRVSHRSVAITSADALFCIAMGALATSRILPVQETAFGIAAAVAIDATLVRALLMPSLMHLMGRWNWWAPPALRRLHLRIGLVESAPAARG